jgi:hypothetical protein
MVHLQVLLSILSLFGIAHLLKIVSASPSGASVFHAAVWVSLILYVGALSNLLPETAIVLRIIGGIGLLLLLRQTMRKMALLTPETGFIIFSIVSFYLLCNTTYFQTFSQVDDFAYWGRMSRYLAEDNALLRQLAPIAALFQYFFTHFSGFQDHLAIFAQGVLIISGAGFVIRPLTTYNGATKRIACCIAFLVIYSLFWILFTGLGTLQVDLLLGISFGVAILAHYCREQNDGEFILGAVLPIALFIVLLKPIGMLFALLALCIICLDYVCKGSSTLRYKLAIIFLAFAATFICYASMRGYLRRQAIADVFSITFTINDILDAFNPSLASERQSLTIKNFLSYIFLTLHPSTYWFAVSVLSVLAIFNISKITRTPFSLTPYLALFGGFVGYSLILLIMYMFVFGEYEGQSLASFERYTITYLLGILIFCMGRLLAISRTGLKSQRIKLWLIAIAFLFIFPNALYFTRHMTRVVGNPNYFYVNTVVKVADEVKKVTAPASKVYFVYSNGSDDESNVFNYLVMPRESNRDCSFIRPPTVTFSSTEPWACVLNVDEFKSKLAHYDFVVFAKTSKEFIDYYAASLNIRPDLNLTRIYEVSKSNDTFTLNSMSR